MTGQETDDPWEFIRECSYRINVAYDVIRQARLGAGIAPGAPMLWPDGLPSSPENVESPGVSQ